MTETTTAQDVTAVAIDAMKRYSRAKRELEEQKETAKKYLELIQEEIRQDLEPLEQELESTRQSLEGYVREENRGEKFKVPSLGTAYLSTRKSVKVEEEEAFVRALEDEEAEEVYEWKFSLSRAKKVAQRHIDTEGEVLPGVNYKEIESLNVRLGKG